ncbi:fimbrial protein [Pseudomonas chlororaphis]|uniref:fimbrial protein n=1 Tax=Pseudomonas chlororaphis TaxID=587753 RepID=UPI0009BA86BD|nr:fimbrial protein [Pseudomonas chlororaphis]
MEAWITGKRVSLWWVCLLAGTLLAPPPVQALNSTTVTVRVMVLGPPCTINNNQIIEVDFGEVITTRLDGSHYWQPINYNLNCAGANSNALRLQIRGEETTFFKGGLQTDRSDLGIIIVSDGKLMPVNNWLNFTYPTEPRIHAVPIKKTSAVLSGGSFSAGATMVVDYQ